MILREIINAIIDNFYVVETSVGQGRIFISATFSKAQEELVVVSMYGTLLYKNDIIKEPTGEESFVTEKVFYEYILKEYKELYG